MDLKNICASGDKKGGGLNKHQGLVVVNMKLKDYVNIDFTQYKHGCLGIITSVINS